MMEILDKRNEEVFFSLLFLYFLFVMLPFCSVSCFTTSSFRFFKYPFDEFFVSNESKLDAPASPSSLRLTVNAWHDDKCY